MIRLQNHLIYALRTAYPLPTSFRRRLLCATASPAHFVAEDYLVTTCGLTPAQALKASKYLSRHKTPNKLDAVRAFLADLGLSKADVAATVARYPRILCCSVDKTLAPQVARLRDIGLSTPQIVRLILLVPGTCTNPAAYISRLAFYLSLLGSYDKVHVALKRSPYLLGYSPEKVVKPNLALLRQCGLTVCDIAKVFLLIPRLFVGPQERLKAVMVRAEELGAPRGTPMFRHALVAAYSIRRESAAAKMELLESLGWSSDQVAMAVAKCPSMVFSSEDRLRRAVNFLTKEAGLEVETIARRPAMLKFSLERRLVPRLKVLKLLKEKGLQGGNRSLQNVASMSDEIFVKTFVHPHEESVPALTDAYAAARAGRAPVVPAS